VLNMF